MKKHRLILAGVALCCLGGCATMERNMYYVNLAKEHPFDYFFPSWAFYNTFDTVDAAYDYIKTAQAKFSRSVDKPLTQGVIGKLIGPAVVKDKPVTLVCVMNASTGRDWIDLSEIDRPLETELKLAVTTALVFLVFYEDRGVTIPGYYLHRDWAYRSNTQVPAFYFEDTEYQADYPVSWNVENAFSYLRMEID
jgi:hypothetical protein